MVCYCARRRVIYIHIPKTGGLTVEKILCELYGFKKFTFKKGNYDFLHDPLGKHGILKYILNYSEERNVYDLNSFFKFSFIRNPRDRCISAIKYLYQTSLNKNLPFPRDHSEFIKWSRSKNYYYMHFCLSQEDCLKNLSDHIDIDYIGRFENLMEDLKYVLVDILKMKYRSFDSVHENKSIYQSSISLEDISPEIDLIISKDLEFIESIKNKIL